MSIKGVICVFFCMISLLCVSGCAGTNQGKTEVNGKTTEYKIDEETKTIEIASEVYKYEKNGKLWIGCKVDWIYWNYCDCDGFTSLK